MKDNIINFSVELEKKDLKDFASSLYKTVITLQIENEQLKQKVEHLEELLKHAKVDGL